MRTAILFLLLLGMTLTMVSCGGSDEPADVDPPPESRKTPSKPIYAFTVDNISGEPVDIADYEGKVLLIVNVASKCGFTKQYAGLQALHEAYADQGLVVMGCPANDFGRQEPGDNEQIRRFCSTMYHVTFPMFAKITVKGDDIHPLYDYLTSVATDQIAPGDITWNFNKFLVSRKGDVIARYVSNVEPLSDELQTALKDALAESSY